MNTALESIIVFTSGSDDYGNKTLHMEPVTHNFIDEGTTYCVIKFSNYGEFIVIPEGEAKRLIDLVSIETGDTPRHTVGLYVDGAEYSIKVVLGNKSSHKVKYDILNMIPTLLCGNCNTVEFSIKWCSKKLKYIVYKEV
jgi:hypothetical protein